MSYCDILVETRDDSRWILIDRPDAMNAVRPKTYSELSDAFEKADADPSTRFIILTGKGRSFCSGDDFSEIMLAKDNPMIQPEVKLSRYLTKSGATIPLIETILRCTKPTIAVINGAAVGMGMDLALLCDFRIASDSAKLGSFFVRRNLIGTAAGTYLLPRMIGLSRAMELLLSGELIDAQEALKLGVVSRVAPAGGLEETVKHFIDKLSSGAPLAQRAIKRCVQKGLEVNFAALDEYGRLLCDEMWNTEDHHEGVMSYVEKRKPVFKQR